MKPYANFVKQCWAGVKEEHPDSSFGDIGALLGEMWREMSSAEKEKYYGKPAKASKAKAEAKTNNRKCSATLTLTA